MFVESNIPVLKQVVPFQTTGSINVDDEMNKIGEELLLRSVTYKVTLENKKDALKISKLLKLDPKEVLRMISQFCLRLPEDKVSKNTNAHGFKDDLTDIYESERVQLYCSMILRERRSILKLVTMCLQNKNSDSAPDSMRKLGTQLSEDLEYVSNCINEFQSTCVSFSNEEYMTNSSDTLDQLMKEESILVIVDSLKVLINLFINSSITKELVLSWFKFVIETNYLSKLLISVSSDVLATISALTTVATLLLIDLDNNFGDLTDEFSYMNDPLILHQITELLANSPTNPMILYAWSFILHRKSLIIEAFASNPTALKILSYFKNDILHMKFLYAAFAEKADELNVCEAIKQCHQLLKFDSIYTAILGSYVITMLPYVDFTPEVTSVIEGVLSNAPEHIIKRFFSDENSERLIILSRAKLPISLSAYLKICNINGVFAYEEFSLLKSYMESFSEEFMFGKYEFDELNPELVRFNESIDVFPPYEKDGSLSLLLDKGIKGKLIPSDNENEQIVIFLYEYNGLSLLGRVLQNLNRYYDPSNSVKIEMTVDILKLITKILDQCPKAAQIDTIAVMSAFIDTQDIYQVIFDIFNKAIKDANITLLVSLMNLLTASLENFSERVWNYLKTSTLLEDGSRSGAIAVILGSFEVVHGNYDFTIAVIELFNGLIGNCINIKNDTAIQLRADVIDKFTNHFIQVFESFIYWKFSSIYQKLKIGTLISDIFSRILIKSYGIGEKTPLKDKPTKVFSISAKSIVNSFLVSLAQEVRSSRPIMAMIENVSLTLNSYQTHDAAGIWGELWIKSCFELSTLLITTRSIIAMKPSTLEESVFGLSQLLVEIYAQYVFLRKPVMKLFNSLVSAKWPNEPPSLLAYLGTYHSNMLLKSISTDLTSSFDDTQMRIYIYDFFASVMDGNFQEGLSIMLITGRDIRESVNLKEASVSKNLVSVLSILKKQISQIYQYPDTAGLHLVEAIALAFNSWTTAKEDASDKEFIGELIKRVKRVPFSAIDSNSSEEELVTKSYEFKLVSKITEILALYLFVSKNSGTVAEIEKLVEDKDFLESVGRTFNVAGYEPSLHANIHREFEEKWPSYQLLQFVRSTLLKMRRYGAESVYDMSLMDELFKQEEEWRSYREVITSASINLKYVESQIAAAKSFGALITSYCNRTKKALGSPFLKLVSQLLDFDLSEGSVAPIFNDNFQERIELAFFIIYKASAGGDADEALLYSILDCCRKILSSNDLDLIAGFADGNVVQYRPLLRTLLAALKLIKADSKIATDHPDVFFDLFSLIISKSARYLFSSIQNQALTNNKVENEQTPIISRNLSDATLILSILKSFVKLNLGPDLRLQIAESLLESGLIKSILNLYSCSHLVKINDEPVLADVTLSFIFELVSVPEIAEKFISHGLFSILVESPISIMIQKGGIRATFNPSYHHIWTNGLLSIILTLLSVSGEKLVPECVMFVKYFIKQIETNLNYWFQDNIVITSATIQETTQIVLLYKVLQAFNADEYLMNYNMNNSNLDNEEPSFIPGLDTLEQRQSLINVFNYLLSHPKFLSMRVQPITLEETRAAEKDNKMFTESFINGIKELKGSLME